MTTVKKRVLSESERATITNGLRVAAERFKAHVQSLQNAHCPHCQDRPGLDGLGRTCKACRGTGEVPDANPVHIRLARQFSDQHSDSLALAQIIEDAESVEVTLDA